MNAEIALTADSIFEPALASVEALPVEDQEVLLDLMRRRLASARRAALVRDVTVGRRDYREGKVRRGTAAELMRDLRSA